MLSLKNWNLTIHELFWKVIYHVQDANKFSVCLKKWFSTSQAPSLPIIFKPSSPRILSKSLSRKDFYLYTIPPLQRIYHLWLKTGSHLLPLWESLVWKDLLVHKFTRFNCFHFYEHITVQLECSSIPSLYTDLANANYSNL